MARSSPARRGGPRESLARTQPDGPLGDAGPDLLVVPGGDWTLVGVATAVVEASALPHTVVELNAAGTGAAPICTGAMVLAPVGFLEGRPATHSGAIEAPGPPGRTCGRRGPWPTATY